MRIAIANDSQLAIEALRRSLTRAGHKVAWTARDGVEAIAACLADTPDVLLMDLRMPVMDGVECTRRIMSEAPCAILIVTAAVDASYEAVYDAMGAGALDAANTPVLGPSGYLDGDRDLLARIETVGKLVGARARRARVTSSRMPRLTIDDSLPPLVAIGASTGGPQALADVLARVPRRINAAIVIIQHVDAHFASGLATWLHDRTGFPTEIAGDGRRPEPGLALVAATNDHLVLDTDVRLRYTAAPRQYPYRPSVDVFFHSAASYWTRRSVGVLLTGMGRDGAAGLLALRQAGWRTIAQDEASSVVYGMPKAAAEVGAVERLLPVGQIGAAIAGAVSAERATRR